MENGSNFNWLTKSTLISSLSLLFALPSTALAWAAELPSFQTSNTSILLDDRPQKSDTSVSELGEIQSHDWAFQALQSLAEKYNCSIANLSLSQLENRPL